MARMSLDTAIRLSAEVKGGGNIDRAKKSLQDLGKNSQTTAREISTLRAATFQFARANDNTIAGIRSSIGAFRGLQEQAKIGSREFQRYGAEIQKLEGKLRGLDGTAAAAGDSLGKKLATGLAAAGIGRGLQQITMQAGRFDAEVRKAAAIEGGAGSFSVLQKEIEKVAAVAAGTPTEVAALATSLSRAGFTAQETTQSLAGIVRGAEATAVSFEQMGSIAADNMRAFGLETSQVNRVVDILTQAANKSNQGVLDVGEAMKYSAPVAKTLGVSIEDLAATLGLMANAGIRGSDAGTGLRMGLFRLQTAAGGADEEIQSLTRGNELLGKAMDVLGAQILDTQGKLKPMDQVILALKDSFAKLSISDQAILAKALFGTEAASKFLATMNFTESKIQEMFGFVRNAGGVAEETQKKMQGFNYSIVVAGGNVEYLANQIGGMIGAAMKPLIDTFNMAISAAMKLPDPIRNIGAAAAAAGISTLGLVVAVNAVSGALALVGGVSGAKAAIAGLLSFNAAAGMATKAATALNLAALGPWALVAVGIAAATAAAYKFNEPFREFVNTIPARFGVFFAALQRDIGQAAARAQAIIAGTRDFVVGAFRTVESIGRQAMQNLLSTLNPVDAAFRQLGINIQSIFGSVFDSIGINWGRLISQMLERLNPMQAILKLMGVDVAGAMEQALNFRPPAASAPAAPTAAPPPGAVPLPVVPAPTGAADKAAKAGAADKTAKDAEKAAKAAEAAGRKYEADQIRAQARLAAEKLQIEEGLQQNTIELDNQRYENSKTLALKQFEFNQSLQSRVLNLWSEGLLGPARAAAKVLSEFMLGFSENTARVADAQRAVNDARQALQQAETVHKQTLANMTARQRIEAMEAGAGQVQSAGVGMGGQATFGSTGRVFNARGWVHGHFQNMNRDALIQDTVDVVMGLLAQGVPTELGSGRQFRQGMTRAEVQSIVRQGIAAHKKYASGIGAIDVFVPEGTRVPLPLSSVANLGGAAGYSGNLPRGTQLMHLDPRSRAGTTGAPLPMSQRLLPGADMPGFQPLPVRDVSGEGNIQQARERLNQAEEELKLIKQQNDELRKFDRKELTQKLTQGLIDQNYELETSAQDLQLRNRLLMEGVRSEVIDGELQKARLYRDQSVVVAGLQEGINAIKDADDKAAAIAGLEQVNQLYAKQLELIDASVAAQIQQGLALRLYIGELKRSLDEMQNIEQVTINVSKTIESEMSSAMSGAVSAVVTGSESVKETLGNMFKNIGEAFVKMATDIIAKQIVMIALQSVLKALGGPSFGGFGSGPGQASPALGFNPSGFAGGTGIPFFANGGIMSPSGPLPLKAYSRGGVASTPQVALFGEGSMNEAYVPLPDGRRIPVALQAPDGNRGDRMRELMGASPAGSNTSPVLSMSFETTTINGVEYVSRDQLESAMAETRKRAANDGAKRGMSMTLDRLQQSPATRSKVGIR
jgi:TP901 family phage tail tape measure protein